MYFSVICNVNLVEGTHSLHTNIIFRLFQMFLSVNKHLHVDEFTLHYFSSLSFIHIHMSQFEIAWKQLNFQHLFILVFFITIVQLITIFLEYFLYRNPCTCIWFYVFGFLLHLYVYYFEVISFLRGCLTVFRWVTNR